MKLLILNWIFAAVFLITMYVGKEPLVQRIFKKFFDMPANVWRKLNWAWIGFFIFLGASNACMEFYFEEHWIDFNKEFANKGMGLIFVFVQIALLSRYLRSNLTKK